MAGNKLDFKKSVVIKNKKASHEYIFLDKYVAGIVLKGTEIKSVRMSKVNLQEAYCFFIDDELWIRSMHVSPYLSAGFMNHVSKSDRKLLLKKKELKKLQMKMQDVGLTIIPTKLFINDRGLAKVEIALAKGKKLYDKRNDIKEKDNKRELSRMKFN
ncbi:SsrA-binding protein SmpB [Flammeovirgaceae bacterium SG7u.111]|nr:SsrA-binding protein SmpB [Flammeovirgaceae bacterium SG7u.132]WPO33144.1 SsrA-binding protein SmpB [Flammeovirgaceae bacterium SG7u.111]